MKGRWRYLGALDSFLDNQQISTETERAVSARYISRSFAMFTRVNTRYRRSYDPDKDCRGSFKGFGIRSRSPDQ